MALAVVEDHQLFREMLTESLNAQPGLRVVLSTASAQQARTELTPGAADVALLDVDLPDGNGVALGIQLRRRDPRIRVLLLSAHNVMGLLLDLPADVRRGWSYLSKASALSIEGLTAAVRATAEGRSVLDPELVRRAVPRRGSSLSRLSARQLEVLRLVATGLSTASIAELLDVSTRSVENHLNAVYSRLGIEPQQNARVAAVLRYLEETSHV